MQPVEWFRYFKGKIIILLIENKEIKLLIFCKIYRYHTRTTRV